MANAVCPRGGDRWPVVEHGARLRAGLGSTVVGVGDLQGKEKSQFFPLGFDIKKGYTITNAEMHKTVSNLGANYLSQVSVSPVPYKRRNQDFCVRESMGAQS